MDDESKEKITNFDRVPFLLQATAYMVFVSSYFVLVPMLGVVLPVCQRYFHGH